GSCNIFVDPYWLEQSKTSCNKWCENALVFTCSGRTTFPRHTENIPGGFSKLKFVFGSCALQALDLVDQHSVTCLTAPSGRKAFQVTGGSGRLYTCFLSCHYCPCPAFAYSVLRRNDGLVCKHILAVYLSQAMAATQQESVSDQQMSLLLSGTMDP
uniref:Zinc finger, SWIM-type containing 7 n=1 Tax=Haplochromis burtoni TaxID=8153 RepID=A0A3Q2XFB8_HAPBU